MTYTPELLATMKRQELQSATAQLLGKDSSKWLLSATNTELRDALQSGEPPARFQNGNGSGDLAAVIAAAINPLMSGRLDEERVIELIEERMQRTRRMTEVVVKRPDTTTCNVGVQHHSYPLLLQLAAARKHTFMVGPAGSFKTSSAKAVATALGLPFYLEAINEATTAFDLLGFRDATSQVVKTKLRQAYEFGGVYLCDEIDAGSANAIATLNGLLANGECGFPDGMVPKHDAFVFLCAGNTLGLGADAKFVGRNQLDGASLDRFAYLRWDYDEDFERHIVGPDQAAWVEHVIACRHAAQRTGIAEEVVFATPRASIDGADLLRLGVEQATVEDLYLWNKIGADAKAKVVANLRRAA
jgi:hypothetical protein